MKRRALVGKIAEELLAFLNGLGEAVEEFVTTPYGQLRISRASYYRNLRLLESKQLIQKKCHGKYVSYNLTANGKNLLKKRSRPAKRSDGLSTFISFDIPESKSRQRTIFRRYLLRNDFLLLQESIFISRNKISQELRDLIDELGIRNYVTSFEGKMTYLL